MRSERLVGMMRSMTSRSEVNLLTTLPRGVVSKKESGACMVASRREVCRAVLALFNTVKVDRLKAMETRMMPATWDRKISGKASHLAQKKMLNQRLIMENIFLTKLP